MAAPERRKMEIMNRIIAVLVIALALSLQQGESARTNY
jgi:hypothetical protein